MNPAINAALIASAAKKQQARDALLKDLKDAKAFGPGTTVALIPDSAEQEEALTELIGTATVRSWNGGYYLDRARLKAREQQQGWVALVVILALLSLGASAIALLSF
jgi:hypothetical protein